MSEVSKMAKTEIFNRISCSVEEIIFLKEYLLKTPFSWIVKNVNMGAKVTKGVIKQVSEVGNLKRIWGNLGGITSLKMHQNDKFFVGQAVSILKHPNCLMTSCSKKLFVTSNYMQRAS